MANNRNRIQTYVNDATHERLQALADSRKTSLSSVVAEILQTIEHDATPSGPSGSPFVTREEMVEYVNEVLMRAEGHWESTVAGISGITQGIVKEMEKQLGPGQG